MSEDALANRGAAEVLHACFMCIRLDCVTVQRDKACPNGTSSIGHETQNRGCKPLSYNASVYKSLLLHCIADVNTMLNPPTSDLQML